MTQIAICQALWGLEAMPQFDLVNELERALERVAGAGFAGVSVNLLDMARSARAAEAAGPQGLALIGDGFVRSAKGLEKSIASAKEVGACHLNVQIAARPALWEDTLLLMEDLQAIACAAPLPVTFETHRGRLTNDLAQTVRLLEAIPNLRLTADLSHYCVAHEFSLPMRPEDAERISQILARADAFHGRIATANQIQVPLAAPYAQAWAETFKGWWKTGFHHWRQNAQPESVLYFVCELGPPPCAITAPGGAELSDRWQEAQIMRGWAKDIWNALEAEAAAS